jgi:hypothetical protein
LIQVCECISENLAPQIVEALRVMTGAEKKEND